MAYSPSQLDETKRCTSDTDRVRNKTRFVCTLYGVDFNSWHRRRFIVRACLLKSRVKSPTPVRVDELPFSWERMNILCSASCIQVTRKNRTGSLAMKVQLTVWTLSQITAQKCILICEIFNARLVVCNAVYSVGLLESKPRNFKTSSKQGNRR